jgi:hypothetical protein
MNYILQCVSMETYSVAVRFEVLKEGSMKVVCLPVVASCCLIEVCRRFIGACRFRHKHLRNVIKLLPVCRARQCSCHLQWHSSYSKRAKLHSDIMKVYPFIIFVRVPQTWDDFHCFPQIFCMHFLCPLRVLCPANIILHDSVTQMIYRICLEVQIK